VTVRWALAGLFSALALAACGNDDAPEQPGVEPETTTAEATLPEVTGLPPAVEQTRVAIQEAAENRDFEALEALIPEKGFTYTFGGPVEGGPTAYWQQIEESPQKPLDALVAILEMPYTKVDDIYVWPFAYDRDPKTLTEAQRALLSAVAGEEEIRQWIEFGSYLGWRAGINVRGKWVFFVAGD
jgi:hypothetical protein